MAAISAPLPWAGSELLSADDRELMAAFKTGQLAGAGATAAPLRVLSSAAGARVQTADMRMAEPVIDWAVLVFDDTAGASGRDRDTISGKTAVWQDEFVSNLGQRLENPNRHMTLML